MPEAMPLSSRRRTHPLPPAPGINPEPPRYPPGKSRLESLPPELLIQIFIISQNAGFVLVSKPIYYLLGYKPSDSLLVEFCRFAPESKSKPENFWLILKHQNCARLS